MFFAKHYLDIMTLNMIILFIILISWFLGIVESYFCKITQLQSTPSRVGRVDVNRPTLSTWVDSNSIDQPPALLLSADIGCYGPALAENIKFLLAKYFIWIKKPIRPETGRLQSVNRHFEVKLSDFGSAVERQNDFGDFIKHQSFTRSTFLNSWENLTIIKCPVCRFFLCKITENVRFWGVQN